MAVLAYVTHEHDRHVVSYSSDPVLTFGASFLWHVKSDNNQTALSRFILPQFYKSLMQEVVDTGGIGEFVARIILLLAMDACGVAEKRCADMVMMETLIVCRRFSVCCVDPFVNQ
jgi:hypothetical protein